MGRRAELCRLGLTGTDHIQQGPAAAQQTRVQTASIRVGERRGEEFHILRWSQSYSQSLKTGRREPLTFREQRRHPSACGSSSRKEEISSGSAVGLSLSLCLSSFLLPFPLRSQKPAAASSIPPVQGTVLLSVTGDGKY